MEAAVDHRPPKTNMGDFHIDILFNILSWLPAKLLMQFRCVSKLWCSIIDNPCLADMHRIEEPTIILLAHPARNITSLHAVKYDGKIFLKASANSIAELELENLSKYSLEGSCNGMLYFVKRCEVNGVFVVNPFTHRKEVLVLPQSQNTSLVPCMDAYGLGFDSLMNIYKMVRVFTRELDPVSHSSIMGTEVHTLGSSSWREICRVPLCSTPLCGRAIFACGAVHWVGDCMVIAFDVKKEEFSSIDHPNVALFQLIEMRGQLALADLSSDRHVEIWLLRDYEKKEWVREYSINISAPIGWSDNGLVRVVGFWDNGEILLKYFKDYLSCNPNTGGLRYIYVQGLDSDGDKSEVFCHSGSLISLSRFKAI